MPAIDRSRISCGVYELHGLAPSSAVLLKRLMSGYKHQARAQKRQRGFAQVIFSDALLLGITPEAALPQRPRDCNGDRFMAYLQKQFPKIKHVELISKDSPSTGNTIKTWIVNIPHPEFRRHKFYSAAPPKPHTEDYRRQIAQRRWPY